MATDAPSASGAGRRKAPLSNFFTNVCSPLLPTKYMSNVSRVRLTNKKHVNGSGSTCTTSRQNVPSFLAPHRTFIGLR